MNSIKKKRGRKFKPHVTAWGVTVDGLYKCPDGRWRITATGKKFTELDERLAVARFYRMSVKPGLVIEVPLQAALPAENLPRMLPDSPAEIAAMTVRFALATRDLPGTTHATASTPPSEWTMSQSVHEPLIWAWVRQMLISNPKYVAKMTGIEQIGYLSKITPPAPLPSLKALGDLWWDHAETSTEERRKVRDAWNDFVKVTGVSSLDGITAEICLAYKTDVLERGWGSKTIRHRLGRVRRLLRFAAERAVAVDEITRVIGAMTVFKTKRTKKITNPEPISREDVAELLKHAAGDVRAMLLCMLNFGMYLQEVVRLEWDQLKNGVLLTQRAKEGQCLRVAVLWAETIAALDAVKRRGEFVFVGEKGLPLTVSGAGKRFRAVRRDAALPHVTASQLRDGAFQAMVESNVNGNLCNLVVGHSNALQDNYVKRNPGMVGPACAAIHRAYFE